MGEYLSKFTGVEIDTRLDKTDSIDTLFAGLNTLNDVKADKTAIPDVSGFATKQELVSGLEPKADKTEIPDVSGFATQAQVQEVKAGLETQISGKQPVGEYALESDIPTIPTTLPNPNAITINGTSYDGTEAVSITIEGSGDGGLPDAPADNKLYGRKNNAWGEVVTPPTYDDTQVRGLITANAESISGLETSKADKSAIPDVSGLATKEEVAQGLATKQPVGEYALSSDIPTVPTTLPNPNALTINGTSYDGSEAVALTIESGGGEGAALATDEEWGTGTTTGKAPNVAQVSTEFKKLCYMPLTESTSFTFPQLTEDGVHGVDVYAIDASSIYTGEGLGQSVAVVTNTISTEQNQIWLAEQSSGFPISITYSVREGFILKKFYFQNRNQIGRSVFSIGDYTIEGSQDKETWTALYSGANASNVLGHSWTVNINNNTNYIYYRINVLNGLENTYIGLASAIPSGVKETTTLDVHPVKDTVAAINSRNVSINGNVYTFVDGTINLPTVDITVTLEDGTKVPYTLVGIQNGSA